MSDLYKNKSYCELIITSDTVTPEQISQFLLIEPNRFHKKGEKSTSKISGSSVIKPNNLWAIRSPEIILEQESLDDHIGFFKDLLRDKEEKIDYYTSNPEVDVVFWIWIETEEAGIGIDINSTDLLFIGKISKSVHTTIISNSKKVGRGR